MQRFVFKIVLSVTRDMTPTEDHVYGTVFAEFDRESHYEAERAVVDFAKALIASLSGEKSWNASIFEGKTTYKWRRTAFNV